MIESSRTANIKGQQFMYPHSLIFRLENEITVKKSFYRGQRFTDEVSENPYENTESYYSKLLNYLVDDSSLTKGLLSCSELWLKGKALSEHT